MLQRKFMHRLGGRLGLFALWLQLALSFGHIHPGDLFRYGHPVAARPGVVELVAPSREAPSLPGTAAVDQNCAICANMALAGSLLPAAPPTIAPPTQSRLVPERRGQALDLAAPPHLLFQTRAPPSA
jgi:hypothetical protein